MNEETQSGRRAGADGSEIRRGALALTMGAGLGLLARLFETKAVKARAKAVPRRGRRAQEETPEWREPSET